jgi:membrane carboxypeptidase/penicillin-binding protein PbpC
VGEISLYELLRAYTVFSDNGNWCDFVAVPKGMSTADVEFPNSEESLLAPSPRPDGPAESLARTSEFGNSTSATPETDDDLGCKKRANPAKVAEIHRILTNRGFKLREFGTDTALDFADRTVFVKTGTSRNFRDNYAVGFSKNFLLAVWSGNKDGSNMKGVSGASGAGEIFSRIIREFESADGAPEEEKLVIATTGYAKILSPLPNSRYRFEKNTPARLQIITPKFSTDLSFDTSEWFLNGEPLSPDGIRLEEIPVGTHVLELVLKKGGTEIRREKSVFERES